MDRNGKRPRRPAERRAAAATPPAGRGAGRGNCSSFSPGALFGASSAVAAASAAASGSTGARRGSSFSPRSTRSISSPSRTSRSSRVFASRWTLSMLSRRSFRALL